MFAQQPADRDTILVTAIALVLALLLFSFRTIPIITADEIGYLGIARELVWGNGPSMVHTDIYSAGYALLLAPFEWLLRDPRAVYHAAMVLNAATLAATVPVLVWVAREFRFDVAPRLTPWFALLVAFWPSQLFQAYLALPEAGLRLLTMAAIVAGFRVTRGSGPAAALALAAIAAAAFAFHARMIPLIVLAALVIGIAVLRRRLGWGWAIASLALLVAGCLAIESLNGLMQVELWENRRPVGGNVMRLALTAAARPGPLVLRAFGHLWYQAASTALLAPIGVAVLCSWLIARRTDPDRAIMAGFVVLLIAGIAAAGAGKLVQPQTFDWLIYGRYLDVVTPAPMLLGALALVEADWRQRLRPWIVPLGLAVLLGGVAIYLNYSGRGVGGPNLIEVGGLTPFVLVLHPFSHEAGLTLLAPAITVLCGIAAYFAAARRALLLVLAVVFVGATTAATLRFYAELNTSAEARMAAIAALYAPAGGDVRLDRSARGGQLYIHQYMMGLHFASVDVKADNVPAGAVVIVGEGALQDLGATCLAGLPEHNFLVRMGGGAYLPCPSAAP